MNGSFNKDTILSMIRNVKQAFGKRDTVLDLTDLIEKRIEPVEFFAENYVTDGMNTLVREVFRRLEGKSEQGVFYLKQAMGGGKTHNLLTLGLLARFPDVRATALAGVYAADPKLGQVRVVAFTGRESDAPFGVWGAIADQLGKKDQFLMSSLANVPNAVLGLPGQVMVRDRLYVCPGNLDLINSGRSPIVESGLEQLVVRGTACDNRKRRRSHSQDRAILHICGHIGPAQR